MASFFCVCCGRHLTVATSIERGLGPICAGRQYADAESSDAGSDKVDIPFDPKTKDIICRRDQDGTLHFNIYQVFKHHSPTGMNWGYGGSGPADFCLNIIALFTMTGENSEPREVQLWDGHKITRTTWNLYQAFKRSSLFGGLPHEGGTIKGEAIRQWVNEEIAASRLPLAA